jgi:tetratricopeptide (TPR) repeat protein
MAVLLASLLAAPASADDVFLHATLVASGVRDDAEFERWQGNYAELREQVTGDVLHLVPATQRAAAIQRALRERVLTGSYDQAASDLRLALARGDFNCLSAAALCYDLCCAAGIELEVWSRPGHVWLQTADGLVLEPAAPAQAPRRELGGGRQITPHELVGKFYYNRGVQLLARGQYEAGLDLMRTALAHDPQDNDARENLLAGLNNWAAEHMRAGRYPEAAQLVRQGLDIEPAYGPLVANQRLLRSARP